MTQLQLAARRFQDDWLQEVQSQPLVAFGLLCALVFMLGLLFSSADAGWSLPEHAQFALLGGGAGLLGTTIGASGIWLVRHWTERLEDTTLGFAAGMMLAAAFFSLLLPGLDAAEEIRGTQVGASFVVIAGLALGASLMVGLDRLTPHAHTHRGPCGPGHARVSRVWLFVWAIAIHNFPEGMAVGVAFAGGLEAGLPLALAIAIQDIPEGLAVALSLRAIGLRPLAAFLISVATGLLEPAGAMLGWALTGGFDLAYPLGMGLAAGAMLFVVSHEVIPETHRRGHEQRATMGLMVGFATMMWLDTCFG
jgi:ZIP family zinc transporter